MDLVVVSTSSGCSRKAVTVTVAELEEEQLAGRDGPAAATGGRLGLAVRPLTAAERQQAGTQGRLLVEDVEGPSALAGVEPGDIIVAVNGRAVATAKRSHGRPRGGNAVSPRGRRSRRMRQRKRLISLRFCSVYGG